MDVTIDIKVCGSDIPPEDRKFVRLYPELDQSLLSYDVMDARKEKKRPDKNRHNQYEYVPLDESSTEEDQQPTVLPKLTCNHCGKTFSRQSTLEQHLVIHSTTGTETWEEIQDAAIKDLENAIAYGTDPSQITLSRQTRLLERKSGSVDEEEEISPPDDLDEDNDNDDSKHVQLKTPAAQIPTQPAAPIKKHECKKCKKSFSRVSLLNRHMKLHLGIKPYQCTVCGWRFLQSYNLKKHLLTHGPKSLRCSQCKASFIDRGQLKTHVLRKHNNKGSATMTKLPILLPKVQSNQKPAKTMQYINTKGEQIFPCHQCEKIFTSQDNLDKHLPTHRSHEKKYSCVVCGMRFHLLQNMQRHLQTHAAANANNDVLLQSQNVFDALKKVDILPISNLSRLKDDYKINDVILGP